MQCRLQIETYPNQTRQEKAWNLFIADVNKSVRYEAELPQGKFSIVLVNYNYPT